MTDDTETHGAAPTKDTGDRPLRVVLADDQDLVRAGFRVILSSDDGIEVVGEAGDGWEAVEVATRERADVVLMDVQMPKLDGLEATRRLLGPAGADHPTKVIILTTFDREDYLFEALRAGASGFLLKNASPEDLIESVRIVARGDALLRLTSGDRAVLRAGGISADTSVRTHRPRVRGAVVAGQGRATEIARQLVLGRPP